MAYFLLIIECKENACIVIKYFKAFFRIPEVFVFRVLMREEMAGGTIVLNEIEAPMIAQKAKPGQFVILKANETGERIPLTIADKDLRRGTITVIYMVVGKSTALFKNIQVGDGYQDVIGPLGKPTHLEKVGSVVCVGGGTGIAVLHPIAEGLRKIGNTIITIIGAKSKDLLILEDKMRAVSNVMHICTDDGSYGHHGFVTEVLKEILQKKNVNMVVGIGPVPMMKFLCEMTKKYGVKTIVSLNQLAGDP